MMNVSGSVSYLHDVREISDACIVYNVNTEEKKNRKAGE